MTTTKQTATVRFKGALLAMSYKHRHSIICIAVCPVIGFVGACLFALLVMDGAK